MYSKGFRSYMMDTQMYVDHVNWYNSLMLVLVPPYRLIYYELGSQLMLLVNMLKLRVNSLRMVLLPEDFWFGFWFWCKAR